MICGRTPTDPQNFCERIIHEKTFDPTSSQPTLFESPLKTLSILWQLPPISHLQSAECIWVTSKRHQMSTLETTQGDQSKSCMEQVKR